VKKPPKAFSAFYARRRVTLRVTQSGPGLKAKTLRRRRVYVSSFDQLFSVAKSMQRHLKPRAVQLSTARSSSDSPFTEAASHLDFQVAFGGYREVETTLPLALLSTAVKWIAESRPCGGGIALGMIASTHAR